MNQLYVISQKDLLNFGCPHCGCEDSEGGVFLSFGSCTFYLCDRCNKQIATVQSSIVEIFQMKVVNTDVCDYIGNHPYKNTDRMISLERFIKQHPECKLNFTLAN